jgi:hypothetical protein
MGAAVLRRTRRGVRWFARKERKYYGTSTGNSGGRELGPILEGLGTGASRVTSSAPVKPSRRRAYPVVQRLRSVVGAVALVLAAV